jgi:hypothetical protein
MLTNHTHHAYNVKALAELLIILSSDHAADTDLNTTWTFLDNIWVGVTDELLVSIAERMLVITLLQPGD